MNTTGHILQGTWRRPTAQQRNLNRLDHWVDPAKSLRRGKFDGTARSTARWRNSGMRG